MPEKKLQPDSIPLTLNYLQEKRNRVSQYADLVTMWNYKTPDRYTNRLGGLKKYDDLLRRQIQAFQLSETLMEAQPTVASLIAGKKSMRREDYREVINRYNTQVHAVIDKVQIRENLSPFQNELKGNTVVVPVSEQYLPSVSLSVVAGNIRKSLPENVIRQITHLYGKRRQQGVEQDIAGLVQLIRHVEEGTLYFPIYRRY